MATMAGLSNVKVIGPINIPNNSTTVIYTMQRNGLVFVSATADFNQDLTADGQVFWRNNSEVETFDYSHFIIYGNNRGTEFTYHQAGNYVPAGANLYQRNMRAGLNNVYVYLYILEFDDNLPTFGTA